VDVDVDLSGLLVQRELGQIANLLSLSGREEEGLTGLGEHLDDRLHLLLETNLEQPVGLVDNEAYKKNECFAAAKRDNIENESSNTSNCRSGNRQYAAYDRASDREWR